MARLYGFSKKDVNRIGSSVRKSESSGKARLGRPSVHKESGGTGGEDYAGEFVVTDSSTDSVTQVQIAEGRIILSIDTQIFSATDVTITESTYVYIKVTYSGGWVLTPSTSTGYPTQGLTEYNIVIAYVTYSGGAITDIEQKQYGPHYGAGRMF